jgi:hypothetical protein
MTVRPILNPRKNSPTTTRMPPNVQPTGTAPTYQPTCQVANMPLEATLFLSFCEARPQHLMSSPNKPCAPWHALHNAQALSPTSTRHMHFFTPQQYTRFSCLKAYWVQWQMPHASTTTHTKVCRGTHTPWQSWAHESVMAHGLAEYAAHLTASMAHTLSVTSCCCC